MRDVIWGSAVALLVSIAASAAAQDHTADVQQAKADLQRAGVDLTKQCGAAKITNLVAWRLRPTYGLLHKDGGNRAVLQADGSCENGGAPGDTTRDGGVATDYLITRGTWLGFDLLSDGGTTNGPHWQPDVDQATGLPAPEFTVRNAKYFTEPVDPTPYFSAPPPVVIPRVVSPPPVEVVPPAPIFDTAALEQAIANLRADVDAGRAENQAFYAQVGSWKKDLGAFVAKYVLPELGTFLAAWKLTKP